MDPKYFRKNNHTKNKKGTKCSFGNNLGFVKDPIILLKLKTFR